MYTSTDSLVVLIRRCLGEREVASGVDCRHVEEVPWSGVDVPCIGFLGVEKLVSILYFVFHHSKLVSSPKFPN